MTVSRTCRITATALLGVAAFGLGAPRAWAHGSTGKPSPDAAHYLSQITGISPPTPGVTASIDPRGEWIEVSNTTGKTLTVLGYAHEPYLQITAAGVAQNEFSPTVQLNQSLFADLNQLGAGSLPPSWRQTSTGHQVRWHDHRIHWMSAERPPAVKAQPGVAHLIGPWTIHMTLAGQPLDLAGTLSWLPVKPSSSWSSIWLLTVDSVAFAGAVGVGAWLLRRHRQRDPGPGPDGPPTDSYREMLPRALTVAGNAASTRHVELAAAGLDDSEEVGRG